MIGYLFALGTSKGAADVIKWTSLQGTRLDVGKAALSKMLTTSLQKGKRYFFSVKAMNGLGVLGPVHTARVTAR